MSELQGPAPLPNCSHRSGCVAGKCIWRKDGACVAVRVEKAAAVAEVRVQRPSRPPQDDDEQLALL